MTRIPIHTLLEELGLTDLVIESPEDLERVKKELDRLIIEAEKKEKDGDETKIPSSH